MDRCWWIWLILFAPLGAGCAVVPVGGGGESVEALRRCLARAQQRDLEELREQTVRVRRPQEAVWDTPGALMLCDYVDAGNPVLAQGDREESLLDAGRQATETDRGPLPSFWGTVERDLKRMPRSLWDDTKAVYTDPGNLVILGVAGASSLAVRCSGVDGKIDDSHGRHDTFQDEWSDAIGVLGNPGTHFAMAGLWYLLGQQTQDDKTYEVGRTLFNALAINGVSTMLLKVAANTDSPNGEGLAWPSGHTSSSFTVAEVLNVSYGPWVGVPSYALATLAAFGRIDDREHDFSDVLFGAALGIVVGHTVADGHRPEIFGGEITAYVSPNSGAGGLAWVRSF